MPGMAMDLAEPHTFREVFEAHERGVHAAAMRILGNPAQAHDVVQDVFLRVWRRPLRQECPALALDAA
jgi:DNA-directed RNA polymerase specialized sigma24 family protein